MKLVSVDSNPLMVHAVMPYDKVILYKHFGTEDVVKYPTVSVRDRTSA